MQKPTNKCARCGLILAAPQQQNALPCPRCPAFVNMVALTMDFMRESKDRGNRHEI